MKNYNYIVNGEIDIEKVNESIGVYHIRNADFEKLFMTNPEIRGCYDYDEGDLSVMVMDKTTRTIYGFIFFVNKSILENKEVQSKLHMYDDDFLRYFSSLNGCCIFGYGFDNRVINDYWVNKMVEQVRLTLRFFYDEDLNNIPYYIWYDDSEGMIDFFKDKEETNSLKYNTNIFYKLYK